MLTATIQQAPTTAIVGAVIMEMGQKLAQDVSNLNFTQNNVK
jgi:hypothetical protein